MEYWPGHPLSKQAARHNTTVEYLNGIRVEQGGACAICGAVEDQEDRLMAVDHDHACCPGSYSCGKCIRGMLCVRCNRGIGFFQDNLKFLESAIRYLNFTATGE